MANPQKFLQMSFVPLTAPIVRFQRQFCLQTASTSRGKHCTKKACIAWDTRIQWFVPHQSKHPCMLCTQSKSLNNNDNFLNTHVVAWPRHHMVWWPSQTHGFGQARPMVIYAYELTNCLFGGCSYNKDNNCPIRRTTNNTTPVCTTQNKVG